MEAMLRLAAAVTARWAGAAGATDLHERHPQLREPLLQLRFRLTQPSRHSLDQGGEGIDGDPGLLQLFFADLTSPEARQRLAAEQLAFHRARLAAYRRDQGLELDRSHSPRGQATVEHWRGETLAMGLLYEEAAVRFWEGVGQRAAGGDTLRSS